jgi:signal transduction histidine kinase
LQILVAQRTAELQQAIAYSLQTEEALRQSELDQAVTAERNRLARDLHDVVTQSLFSASLVAEALSATWQRDPAEGQELLQELRQLTRGALAEMRTLLLELRPAALVEADLSHLLRQLAEALTGREGVPVTVTVEGKGALPEPMHIALYRIAQEALNNISKHACAQQVTIVLRRRPIGDETNAVELRISDDGCGFDQHQVASDHLGLDIMRERADAIGARLTIESELGHGTQITVIWPEGQQGDRHG